MIYDMHSHAWPFPQAFSADFLEQSRRSRAGVELDLSMSLEHYQCTSKVSPGTRTVVFGGKARLSGLWVDDKYVAAHVAQDPARLAGFLSVDPMVDGWELELHAGHEELGLKGVQLLPSYAGFRVDDARLEPLWEYASAHSLPVTVHSGATFIKQAPLECARPRWIEPVAQRHPDLKLVLAHLGHPYDGECMAVIRKHPNVFADLSAQHFRPWQLYNSLMLVQEYEVWHKVLFGTDYPYSTVDATVAGLHSLNGMLEGTQLPRLNEEELDGLIYRDGFALLGLE